MNDLFPQFAAADWPAGADPQCVVRERERFHAAARDESSDIAGFAEALAASRAGARLLEAIFGNSPYLSGCLTQDPVFAATVLREGPDATFKDLRDALVRARIEPVGDIRGLMSTLRTAKRRSALLVALADIAGLWTLERVTGALSDFADAAIDAAVAHLLREAASAGGFRRRDPADPCRGSGFVIIGMGKLGAERAQLFERYRSDRFSTIPSASRPARPTAADRLRPARARAGADPR